MRLTVQEAARLLNVSTKTIYRWAADGRLPGYRVQKQYRFDRTELVEWATAQRISVDPAFEPDEPHPEHPVPTFAQALEWGGVHYRVEGSTRDEVLRATVTTLGLVDDAERDLLLQGLISREELASTSIGDGFALPHLRSPQVDFRRSTVSLCFLDGPVDWGAPDLEPVTALFVVLGSTVRSALQLHSRTFFALRDPAFRAIVTAHGAREGILADARRVSEAQQRASR